jgi:hypothetical protein
MARDPFAPVAQSTVPKWVWIVVGMVSVVIVGGIGTIALVLSRRLPPAVAAPAVTAPATPTAGAPTTPAGDTKTVAANTESKPAGGEGEGEGDGDKADKPEKKKHRSSGTKHAKAEKKPAPSAPAAPPKPKTNMSQKDIDKLLGI